MAGKLNVYNTSWNDRIATRYVENEDGDDDIVLNWNKSDSFWNKRVAAQVNDMFRLDMGMSYGNWRYADDATGTYRDSDGGDRHMAIL